MILSGALSSATAQGKIETELVSIKTSDGIDLHGAVRSPASGKPKLGFGLAQGTGAEFYESWLAWFGPKLAEMGYIAISLLSDMRDGGSDPKAHGFTGREPEVFSITMNWMKKRGLLP